MTPRRTWLQPAFLLMYVSTLISGGLHQHDNPAAATSAPFLAADGQSQVNNLLEPGNEESHDCTICFALHQAKAPITATPFLQMGVPVGEAIIPAFASFFAAVPLVKLARAPPSL